MTALQALLHGLGVPVPVQASLNAEKGSDARLSFSTNGVRRRGLLPGQVRDAMDTHAGGYINSKLDTTNHYAVARSVWEAKELDVTLGGSSKTVASLSAKLVGIANGLVGLRAQQVTKEKVTYTASTGSRLGCRCAW